MGLPSWTLKLMDWQRLTFPFPFVHHQSREEIHYPVFPCFLSSKAELVNLGLKVQKEENIDEMVNSWIQRLEELLPHVTREPAVGQALIFSYTPMYSGYHCFPC